MPMVLAVTAVLVLAVLGRTVEGDPCRSNHDCGWSGLSCVVTAPVEGPRGEGQPLLEGTCRPTDDSLAAEPQPGPAHARVTPDDRSHPSWR